MGAKLTQLERLTLASSGTRQRVYSGSTNIRASVVGFLADSTNSGTVYVGDSGVTSTNALIVLEAGEFFAIDGKTPNGNGDYMDLGDFWWDGSTTSDKLRVGYLAVR